MNSKGSPKEAQRKILKTKEPPKEIQRKTPNSTGDPKEARRPSFGFLWVPPWVPGVSGAGPPPSVVLAVLHMCTRLAPKCCGANSACLQGGPGAVPGRSRGDPGAVPGRWLARGGACLGAVAWGGNPTCPPLSASGAHMCASGAHTCASGAHVWPVQQPQEARGPP